MPVVWVFYDDTLIVADHWHAEVLAETFPDAIYFYMGLDEDE